MESETKNITVLSQNVPCPESTSGDQPQEMELTTQMAYVGFGTIISVSFVFFLIIVSASLLRKRYMMSEQGKTIFGKLPKMLPRFLRKKQKRKGLKGSNRHRPQQKLSEVAITGKLSNPSTDIPLEGAFQGKLGHGLPDAVINNNELYHIAEDLTKPTEATPIPACTPSPPTNISGLTQLPDQITYAQGDVQLTITSEIMESTISITTDPAAPKGQAILT